MMMMDGWMDADADDGWMDADDDGWLLMYIVDIALSGPEQVSVAGAG